MAVKAEVLAIKAEALAVKVEALQPTTMVSKAADMAAAHNFLLEVTLKAA